MVVASGVNRRSRNSHRGDLLNPPIQPARFFPFRRLLHIQTEPLDVGAQNSKNSPEGTKVRAMNFSQMKDERILAFYENVRQQVEIDKSSGGRYRFAGEGVKQYAEKLREEMDRRRLGYRRIDWS